VAIIAFMEDKDQKIREMLGSRIRSLRTMKKWTQQELGEQADINYKFLGEIERGQQNPSFHVLVKIADALEIDLPELFRFEPEITDRKELIKKMSEILKSLNDDNLRQVFLMLKIVYPIK
jgi:transcriptional regulator with XRE-family HTH domain